jgi:hypothetical protein
MEDGRFVGMELPEGEPLVEVVAEQSNMMLRELARIYVQQQKSGNVFKISLYFLFAFFELALGLFVIGEGREALVLALALTGGGFLGAGLMFIRIWRRTPRQAYLFLCKGRKEPPIRIRFFPAWFVTEREDEDMTSVSKYSYRMIRTVQETEGFLFLFLVNGSYVFLDKTALSPEQKEQLLRLFREHNGKLLLAKEQGE